MEGTGIRSQADRPDVIGEGDRGGEAEESDVIVTGGTIIIGMPDDLRNGPGNLVEVAALLSLTTEVDREA